MTTLAQTVPVSTVWLRRLRFVLATAVVWAGLHFLAGERIIGYGLDRPLVLAGASRGPLAGALVVGLLWLGAMAAALIVGTRDTRRPLMVLGLALALWAAEGGARGGTIDSWLILRHDRPGPPSAGPYWALLGDYLYLLAAIAGAYGIAAYFARQPGRAERVPAGPPAPKPRGIRTNAWFEGAGALLMTTVIAGLAMYALTGPATEWTRRGQVYFAAAVGFGAGAYAAGRMTKVRDPLWYCPAPFLVGIVGAVVAALHPALRLPDIYRGLDTLPAWGLVRALPVELVGVGLTALLAALPASIPPAAQDECGERTR